MPRSKLNPRQQAVRRELVKTSGMVSNQELGDKFGVNRITIWKDRQVIKKFKPIPEDPYIEQEEIDKSLAHFDDINSQLMDELEQNEIQVETFGSGPGVVAFLNVKVNLLNQVRQNHTDRRSFLLDIGYLKATPKEFSLTTPLHKMTDSDIRKEIMDLDEQIALIKGPLDGNNRSDRSSVDEAETLSLPTETDDRIQGA